MDLSAGLVDGGVAEVRKLVTVLGRWKGILETVAYGGFESGRLVGLRAGNALTELVEMAFLGGDGAGRIFCDGLGGEAREAVKETFVEGGFKA